MLLLESQGGSFVCDAVAAMRVVSAYRGHSLGVSRWCEVVREKQMQDVGPITFSRSITATDSISHHSGSAPPPHAASQPAIKKA